MPNIYAPDSWVLLKISDSKESIIKVLGGWSGSYLYGSSWRLSSGVEKIEDKDDDYVITNYSGSVYLCPKTRQTANGIMCNVLDSYKQKADREEVTIEIVSVEEASEFLKEGIV